MNHNNMKRLQPIREQIDKVDQQLLELLSQRLALVEQVSEIKSCHNLPICDPQREQEIIAKHKKNARAKGISETFIEDILRRCMQESYNLEHRKKSSNNRNKKITIVGGAGKLGSIFANTLKNKGFDVAILDKNDWNNAKSLIDGSDVVMVSVPISQTLETIKKLKPYLTENMILCDLTSTKAKPIEKMLEIHKGAVVGFHPMFGSDIENFVRQVIIVCNGRNEKQYRWLIDEFEKWGAKLQHCLAKEHDHAMSFIQALRHFSTFVFGKNLAKQNINIEKILALSSPIYRLELAMTARLFAQDASLYADIIASNPQNIENIKEMNNLFSESLAIIEQNNNEQFMQEFDEIKNFFGDYSKELLEESSKLLKK